jgi:hypothetical protein
MSTGSEWRKASYSTDTGGSCVEVGHWRKSSYSDSTGGNCVEVGPWRKSTHSTGTGGSCVEVSAAADVLVRDTTDRDGAVLSFRGPTWHRFLATLR